MGDWDVKSHYAVGLEYENTALKIKNKRLKACNDNFFDFVQSDPELCAKWISWLSDADIKKEISDSERNVNLLEDLHLRCLESKA